MNDFIRRFPVLKHRCAYLFFALVSWILVTAFLAETELNQIIEGLLNLTIMVTAVAAVSRSMRSFSVSLMFGVALAYLWTSSLHTSGLGDDVFAWGGLVAFYVYVLSHLIRYVMRAEVVTTDKLFGAASVYLMLGIAWAGLYGVVQYFYPSSFAFLNQPQMLFREDLIYFSFTTLTTAGYGDIIPVLRQARILANLEACTGVLYTAILIARLASEYPSLGAGGFNRENKN